MMATTDTKVLNLLDLLLEENNIAEYLVKKQTPTQ